MDYYIEQAKTRIENEKHEAEVLSKAWAGVKRVKTKSGEDFKVVSKNFINAYIRPKNYTPSEKEISVVISDVWRNCGKTYSDSIDIDRTIYSGSKEAEEYKDRLIERGQYLHPYIELTPSEIEEVINARIEYYNERAKVLGEELAEFEATAEKVVSMRKEAEEFMKKHNSIYYDLRSILREERR